MNRIVQILSLLCAVAFFTQNAFSVTASVKLGDERLKEETFYSQLKGKRVGVLAHSASRTRDGQHVVDVLTSLPQVQMKMIFSPEHGYRSLLDEESLPDSKDPVTGLPVYSLYGQRKAPTADMLSQLDVVLVDLQDVGIRFYTYPSTMVYLMRAAKKAGKKVMILDRPNPINGSTVEGVVLSSGLATGGLTTLASIPTRHGMTLGELAVLYNDWLGIGVDLSVVPMSNWNRSMTWEQTAFKWIPPSPALTTEEQGTLYGVFGALEASGLAVGRGQTNEMAFRVYGAPWIHADIQDELVEDLEKLKLPGLKFTTVSWIPTRATHKGKRCRGFKVSIQDTSAIQGFRSMIEVSRTLYQYFKDDFALGSIKSGLGSTWVVDAIRENVSFDDIQTRAQAESADFNRRRASALIYR